MAKLLPFSHRKLRWFYVALLALLCVSAYDPRRPENSSGDSISPRYWPVAIVKYHTWKMNPFREIFAGVGYSAFSVKGDLLPRLGWGLAPFTVPFYQVAEWFDWGGSEWNPERVNRVSRWNAILLCTLSVICMFLISTQFASLNVSMGSAVLFALGTWNWSMGAQGLFPQTPTVLAHVLNIWLLWKISVAPKADKAWITALTMGALHTLIWALRPQDILLAAPAVLAFRERKSVIAYGSAVLALMIPITWISWAVYGSVVGQYGVIEQMSGGSSWHWNAFAGLAGLLFSPNRGAIVFFPLLLLVPFYWKKLMPSPRMELPYFWRAKKVKVNSLEKIPTSFSQALALSAVIYFISLCFLVYWHGTWAYGPRYLYNILPYIWPPITLALSDFRNAVTGKKFRLPRWALALTLIASLEGVFVHGLGHRNYDPYVWNFFVVPVDDEKSWSYREFMLTHVWRAGSNLGRYPDALDRLKRYGF